MKKIAFFLLTAIAVTGCSSDDNTSTPSPVIGPEVHKVDFTGKKAGDEAVLEGKGFLKFDEKDFKILFTERLPETQKSISSTGNTTRALPPTESNKDVEAHIESVQEDKIIFTIPKEAGNGNVTFVYKTTRNTIGYFTK